MGTADFYAVVEGFDEVADSLVIDTTELGADDEGALLCFLVLTPGTTLDSIQPQLRKVLRTELSPRHVPDRFIVVDAIPRTLNGKKCEVPVKKILAGGDPDTAVSREHCRIPMRWHRSSSSLNGEVSSRAGPHLPARQAQLGGQPGVDALGVRAVRTREQRCRRSAEPTRWCDPGGAGTRA